MAKKKPAKIDQKTDEVLKDEIGPDGTGESSDVDVPHETPEPESAVQLSQRLADNGISTAVMNDHIYVSHKKVKACPMSRLDYNHYRGWPLPDDENGEDDGYLVEYLDGGKPNHPWHSGYVSWSPKEQFDNGYTIIDSEPTPEQSVNEGLYLGEVLIALKAGKPELIAKMQGWPDTKYLYFKKGQFFIHCTVRGVEEFKSFSVEMSLSPKWQIIDLSE